MNKSEKPKYEELSEEEREKRMKTFVKENEKLMKEYAMLQKFDDCLFLSLTGFIAFMS